MKETVRTPQSPVLAGIALVIIAGAYFFLLGTSGFEEPGENLEYDIAEFQELDDIPTNYDEDPAIALSMENPRALAVAPGKIYVAGKDTIAVYTTDGQETAKFSITGTPISLAVAPEGTLYAGLQNTVLILDANGKQQAEWKHFTDRSYLTAIAIHGEDIYVADAGKRVVLRHNKAGEVLARIGEKDPARDVPGLEVPSPYLDLAINPDGELWVVNPGKLGLERFRPDGSIVTSWYNPSVLALAGFPGCCNPTHIAFASNGELYTCEKGLVRVKQYEVTAGTFDGLVAASEKFPQEQSARDLAIDDRDRVLVLDPKRNAVRIFAQKATPVTQADATASKEVQNGSRSQPQ